MKSASGDRRFPFAVYAAELSIGIVAGLALFLFLLWMLQLFFPGATTLGELVRSRRSPVRGPAPLADTDDSRPMAVLAEIHNDIRDKLASSVVWSVAQRGASLSDGDAVQSYDGSSATIRFDEHNALELGEKSLIVLRKPRRQGTSTRRRASVLFMDGFLRGKLGGVGPERLDLEVLAGGGTVRPHGPGEHPVEIALTLDKDTAALAVREGSAEVVWNDRVTVVPSGHMVTFDPDHAPGVPIALPGRPVLVSPPDAESFRSRAAPPRVSFSWRPVDETSEFTVQIARDPAFAQIVFDRTQEQSSFTHGALAAGDYYWRVRGRRGSIDGPDSRTSRFEIETDQRLPLLRLQLPEEKVLGRTLVIRGETEPGCRVIIGDVTVPTDGSGRFEHSFELRDGYNFIVVQAVDPVGNTAFESRTIVAESPDSERKP